MLEAKSILQLKELKAILERKNWSISCAESLTSGNVQGLLGALTGSSNVFAGGVCAYSLDQKVSLLGVDREHATSCNCVSPETAKEMAEGVMSLMGTEVAIATTGYIEPYYDAEHKIDGPFAYLAVAIKGQPTQVFLEGVDPFVGQDRTGTQMKVAQKAVYYAFAELIKLED